MKDEPVTITLTLSLAEWLGVAAYLVSRGVQPAAVRHVIAAVTGQVTLEGM